MRPDTSSDDQKVGTAADRLQFTDEDRKTVTERFDKLWHECDSYQDDRKNNFAGVIGEITVSLAHNSHEDNIKLLRYMCQEGMISLDEIAHAFVC